MYRSNTTLPSLIHSDCYTTHEAYIRDRDELLRHWQMVAVSSSLSRPGDYIALTRLGVPLIVRNHEGRLIAVGNVCAHRQCELVEEGSGHAPQLKCPYHGWCYGGDGRTRKLPLSKEFPNFDHPTQRLMTFPVCQIGGLIFVHLGRSADESAEASMDNDGWLPWKDEFAERTNSNDWQLIMRRSWDLDCDWKVAVEGSLEGYHLEEVHPHTLGPAPDESMIEHKFTTTGTTLQTMARNESWMSRLEEQLASWMTGSHSPMYRHVHVFPNVTGAFQDGASLIYQFVPVGPGRSTLFALGFGRRATRAGWWGHAIAKLRGLGSAALVRRLIEEDAAVFLKVQRGMAAAANHPGFAQRVFGRSEERLHAFHQYWSDKTNE